VIMPNPLTDTADPGRYVSRAETEGVLAELEAALEEGVRIAVLSGPPGMGKTLLLHVLEERQRDARQLVFSPFLHFRPNEADEWLRALLLESGLEGHTD
jgi:type II secretory pathway predicted ATPase ExeA